MPELDPELEEWRRAGRSFDYCGFEIFYRVEGELGERPALLLIHGYPFNSFDWKPIWGALAERFVLIAPDMLGMGFSDKPREFGYSVHDHADMHEALLEHLGVGRVHVLAHDLGDSVAQEMLARHERGDQVYGRLGLESLCFLNGGLFSETYRPRLIQILLSKTPLGGVLVHLLDTAPGRAITRKAVAEVFGPGTKPSERLDRQFQQILDFNGGRLVSHKLGRFLIDRPRHRNRWVRAMRETQVPMRLIDGPYDPNSGRHLADRYCQIIPDPDVVILDAQIGHWPQIEAPEAVLEAFFAFHDQRVG